MPDHRDNRRANGGETNPIVFATIIGFFAGLFWGVARWLAVSFKFTEVPQAFLADPFVRRAALSGGWWQAFGLLLFILMSIVAAIVYWFVLGRLSGPWPGLVFGAAWWALVFFVVGPAWGMVQAPGTLRWSTHITEFCLYLVWGLFIGYSIAFEFHDEAAREPKGKADSGGRKAQPAS